MVKVSVTLAVVITLCISLLVPIAFCIVYGVKNRGKAVFSAWFIGAAGFVITQLVIRVPLLNVVAAQPGFNDFVMKHYILYCFIMAFTAGLFEVVGRAAAAKIMQKNLTYERSFAAGLGHGGMEAMLIVGMTYVNNLIYIVMINSGNFDAVVEQTAVLGADTAGLLNIRETFLAADPVLFYLAGYERLLTMIVHVALSLIVCYSISRKKGLKGIGICLGLHCAMDFVPSLVSGMANGYIGSFISINTSQIITYVFLTAVAVGAVFLIGKIRKDFKS